MNLSVPIPLYIAGSFEKTENIRPIINPYTGEKAYEACFSTEPLRSKAIVLARQAFSATKKLPSFKKYEILQYISHTLQHKKQLFAEVICAEAGKPMQFALGEVDRAVITFSLAADLVRQQQGELLPLDLSEKHIGRKGIVQRVPVGPLLAITPFNFPLNLVAHKVAPAIAAGNPIVLKPASKTPVTALLLAEIIAETDWPAPALSVLPTPGSESAQFLSATAFNKLSFTGSPDVGWELKQKAGKMKVSLELGGDAAAIITETAAIEDTAKKCAYGAFAYAGQVCISVQRILVQENKYHEFKAAFEQAVKAISYGDPKQEKVISGPLIDLENRQRIEAWITEAVNGGAHFAYEKPYIENNLVSPTVLENVPANSSIGTTEAFGPVVYLEKYKSFKEAMQKVNNSRYGLQAGVFTDSASTIKTAFSDLEVGGVVINDVPTLRVDNMPYGGMKDSGLGREGVAYAFQEMTEPKVLVW